MTRIAAVQATPLTAPWETIFAGAVPDEVRRPAAHFAAVPRRGQYATLVTVTDEDGVSGIGEAWGLPSPGAIAALIDECIAPAVVGADADDPEALHDRLRLALGGLGYASGPAWEAASGLDLALWDRRGHRRGASLAVMLGGVAGVEVPGYASPVVFCGSPMATAGRARLLVEQGFAALKVKIGRTPAIDLTHLRAVRLEIGPTIGLLADANGGYSRDDAVRFAQGAADLGLIWLEEPVPADDVAGLALVRRASPVPIATGENAFSLSGFTALLDAGAADVLTPNLGRCGGITGLRRIHRLARDRGATVALHGVGGAVVVSASLGASAGLGLGLFEYNRLPNPLRDGLAGTLPRRAPGGAGLGVTLDEGEVARWSSRRRAA